MSLSKAEVNVPSQVPQGHSRPPAIGPIMSPNIAWLTITSSLHSWFYPEDLGKSSKTKRFQEKSVHVCTYVCVSESEREKHPH